LLTCGELARGNTTIRNCLIARNTAHWEGGGGVSLGGGSLLENCTIVGNNASKTQTPAGRRALTRGQISLG
jgi:hypothetical protein